MVLGVLVGFFFVVLVSFNVSPHNTRLAPDRARLERDVRLLNAGDADLIEELSIELLGFVRPGDRVVVAPAPPPTAR